MDKKEILQILQNHLQTFVSNDLGWELNGIDEEDIEEVAEDIVKKLTLTDVVSSSTIKKGKIDDLGTSNRRLDRDIDDKFM